MIISLSIILLLVIALPLSVRKVEENLEIFLLIMGIAAAISSNVLTFEELKHIFSNTNLYLVTGIVLGLGIVFWKFESKIDYMAGTLLEKIPLRLSVAFVILVLGLLSSLMTAIIASMLLAEIVSMLPINRKTAIRINIIACFSIGFGAALTPIGEPLSTIVVSKMNGGFFYLFDMLAPYVIPMILLLTAFGVLMVHTWKKDQAVAIEKINPKKKTLRGTIFSAVKVFIFIVALELLGAGFAPLVDQYITKLSDTILYVLNLLSAILDNATLAAAEISPAMSAHQIQTILMSLLISGGMLITGNIPNIITAGRLKIRTKEWAKTALPIGGVFFVGYFVFNFFVLS